MVDPRVRGENGPLPSAIPGVGGRSPRARGKLAKALRTRMALRSIPACAGKTVLTVLSDVAREVDPRVRGENRAAVATELHAEGRSPRARGKPFFVTPALSTRRSIPACAGKTAPEPADVRPRRVDPRVRGENRCRWAPAVARSGRSPRARGKPPSRALDQVPSRSIPACAGKTDRCHRTATGARVDPRVRGENRAMPNAGPTPEGRSPRARGKHSYAGLTVVADGSIPACAGKTPCSRG